MLWQRTDSITHSMPANSAPTFPNPFPVVHIPLPISRNTAPAFCVVFRLAWVCCLSSGSSYANEADMSEKKAPIPKPVQSNCKGYPRATEGRHDDQNIPAPPASTVFTAQDSIAIPAYPSHFLVCWIAARSSSVKPGGRGSFPGA